MTFIDKIKNFVITKTGDIQKSQKSCDKKSGSPLSSAQRTNEDDLTDTSSLEKSKENKKGGSFWKKAGRVALGIVTLGISEIIRNKKNSEENKSYAVNGEFDKEIYQGGLGDCALIGSLCALSKSEEGAKIIKDAIKINYNDKGKVESYSVYYKGIDETVTISKEELDEANDNNRKNFQEKNGYSYSSGDDDMLLMELSWQKINEQAYDKIKNIKVSHHNVHSKDENGPSSLNAVSYEHLIKAFADTSFSSEGLYLYRCTNSYRNKELPNLIEKIDNAQTNFKPSDVSLADTYKHTDSDGNVFMLTNEHEYAAQKTENGYIFNDLTNGTKREFSEEQLQNLIAIPEEIKAGFRKDFLETLADENPTFMTFGVPSYEKEKTNLVTSHLYAVKEIKDNKITIINPWNTSLETTLTFDEVSKLDFDLEYGYSQ